MSGVRFRSYNSYMITPGLGNTLRRKVRKARHKPMESGSVLDRTVIQFAEAVRHLVRVVDAQMRTLDVPRVFRHGRWMPFDSALEDEMVSRGPMPCNVTRILLIHRETGLPLWHISRDSRSSSDSDLVSGMLTAIQDFAHDAFGGNGTDQLNEIQYGERRILIERAQHTYLAVILDGPEPPGFRTRMREQLMRVERDYEQLLCCYAGDPMPLAPVAEGLRCLMTAARGSESSSAQSWGIAGVVGLLAIAIIVVHFVWTWGRRPAPSGKTHTRWRRICRT